jgi:hypothetical protein
MKRLLFFLCLGACSTAFAAADERNGAWWQQQSPPSKDFYLLGISDGIELGKYFSKWDFMEEKSASADNAKKRVDDSYAHYVHLLKKVTVGQMSDGLDVFYGDYRNRGIKVYIAFWPVLKTITGSPQPEVDQLILNLRKRVTDD